MIDFFLVSDDFKLSSGPGRKNVIMREPKCLEKTSSGKRPSADGGWWWFGEGVICTWWG